MRNNKKMIILITVLSVVVIGVLAVLLVVMLNGKKQPTGNQNIENNVEQNTEEPVNEVQNTVINEATGNLILVDPNINPSGTTTTEPTESFVSRYYYNQLDETAKTIYTELKNNKSKFISGNYSVDRKSVV